MTTAENTKQEDTTGDENKYSSQIVPTSNLPPEIQKAFEKAVKDNEKGLFLLSF